MVTTFTQSVWLIVLFARKMIVCLVISSKKRTFARFCAVWNAERNLLGPVHKA